MSGPAPAARSGLAPRPVPEPEVAALLAAAAWELWPRPAPPSPGAAAPPTRSWRFSGRWWAKPLPLRRDRPTAR